LRDEDFAQGVKAEHEQRAAAAAVFFRALAALKPTCRFKAQLCDVPPSFARHAPRRCGVALMRETVRLNTDSLRESAASRHSRRKILSPAHNPG